MGHDSLSLVGVRGTCRALHIRNEVLKGPEIMSDRHRTRCARQSSRLYDLGDRLLVVASDRISAFDYILEDEILIRARCSRSFVLCLGCLTGDREPHLISADVADLPERFKPYADVEGRFMLVKKADMYPIECIVRG